MHLGQGCKAVSASGLQGLEGIYGLAMPWIRNGMTTDEVADEVYGRA